MNASDSELLFSAIKTHLSPNRAHAITPETNYTFWDGRTRISAAEMAILMTLTNGPLSAEALARHLARDLPCTRESLDALVAKGILERHGEGYTITMATGLYCRAMAQEWRSGDGEHRQQ